MAYIEFRPMTNIDGDVEFDLCAFTETAAKETFDNLDERISRDADGDECFLRRVNWTDQKVEQFNAEMQTVYTKIKEVAKECRVFAPQESKSA